MNKALFVGATDISDLLQYISKVIASSGKRVLLVDGTNELYIEYGTPIPSPELKVIEYEGFDVAVGFDHLSELKSFLNKNQQYDQLILHCSKDSFLTKEDMNWFEFKYIATSQEKISIDKTVEFLNSIFVQRDAKEEETKIMFTRIHINSIDSNMAEDYLETVLFSLPISWSENPYELLYDNVDYAVKVNNQNDGKISIRRLSRNFKKVIQWLSGEITGLEQKEIKPVMKQVMRRSFVWGK